MSAEGGSARGVGREGSGKGPGLGPGGPVMPQPYPAQFYPVAGYQGLPPNPWYPGHPSSGAPTQWTPSWSPAVGYPAPPTPWSTHQAAATTITKGINTTAPAAPSDEYTVDTLRRIYNDDDGRVEIQRVKVQRRQPETGVPTFPPVGAAATAPSDAMAMVPVGNFPLNERRPPPRKNRRKQQMQVVPASGGGAPPGSYPWYPCMPYMPYPYPYPYYFGGCMWPPSVPAASTSTWSGHDESERASSAQGSLPTTLESQRLESRASHPIRGSLSPELHRSPSPAATSHITDIAPSDSISVRGHRRETSLERALRGPTPPPRTKSRASSSDFNSSEIGKTQKWMIEMHRALGTTASDVTDKSSVTNTTSDVVIYKKIPPKRTRRKAKLSSISDKDIDNLSDIQSVTSDMSIESSRLSSELNYAFRKLEKSVDAFKSKVSVDSTPIQSPAPSPSIDIVHSSGEMTPTDTDMIGSPMPDISIPQQETTELQATDDQDQQITSAASLSHMMSLGSVCSLPSLETARTESVVELYIPQKEEVPSMQSPHSLPDAPKHGIEANAATVSTPPSVTPITEASAEAEASASHDTLTSGTVQISAITTSTSMEAKVQSQPASADTSTQSVVESAVEAQSNLSATSTKVESCTTNSTMEATLNSVAPSAEISSKSPTEFTATTTKTPVPAEVTVKSPTISTEGTTMTPTATATPELPATPASSPQPVKQAATAAPEKAPPATVTTPLSLPPPQSSQPSTASVSSTTQPATASPSSGNALEAVVKEETPAAVQTGTKPTPGSTPGAPTRVTPVEGVGGGGADAVNDALTDTSGRDSRASSGTFFSMRPSDDLVMVDTDSTDIPLPTTDSATADEGEDGGEEQCACHLPDDGHKWVLQQPGETPDLAAAGEDDQRNTWRAEVSLWRAKLVVSLCRGRGLDRQDWATFHLLVHHPLTLDLKLSLLHASRLCAANSSTGAALVRVALIHLAQCGETLLQPESSRQAGWRTLKVDSTQPWAPVKGAEEILRSLGYRERDDNGVLKYPRRSGPEVSVLARLTLDLLVLAEELRLYLTGTHQYPTNISDLFFPASSPDLLQRPSSSAGSFVSAMSETSLGMRPDSRASSVTDDDTETLQASVCQVKTNNKKVKRETSSEEEVTLKDDIENPVTVNKTSTESVPEINDLPNDEVILPANHVATSATTETQELGSTVSLPVSPSNKASVNSTVANLPDLQSARLSFTSEKSSAESNSTITPGASPVTTPSPVSQVARDNPEEHIYEEIDVIKQQVQALRASSVPVESVPPPLPPKKKMNSGGDDDSGLSLTYPQVEWSSASMPGSLRGGSTGARRKKRRAPMPPEFMPSDWKQPNKPQESSEPAREAKPSKDSKDKDKQKSEYRNSLNPFYEEIDSVKEKVEELKKNADYENKSVCKDGEENPFIEQNAKVAGFIGKNPFYEEVELLKNSKEFTEVAACHDSRPLPNLDGSLCAMGSLAELQDEAVAVRPKRKAPKPPPTPQPFQQPSTSQSTLSVTPSSTPQPITNPSELDKLSLSTEAARQTPATPEGTPKDEARNLQQKIATNDKISSEGGKTIPQQSQDQPATVSDKSTSPQTTDKDKVSLQQNVKLKASADDSVGDNDLEKEIKSAVPLLPKKEINRSLEKKTDNSAMKKDGPSVTSDSKQADKGKTGDTPVKINRASHHQRVPLQHPTTPPPPPPTTGAAAKKTDTTPAVSPTPESPPKAPLALLDDIPYMDANEIKYAKAQKTPQSPRLIIPPAPQLSPTTSRQTPLLLGGSSSVPFIDDSDLPPDCPPPPPPPPPPPGSPPESPPETPTPRNSPPNTPHTSPPQTPHTSPPETPHNSPPETPQASPRGSPITVTSGNTANAASSRQGVDDSTPGINEDDTNDEAPPVPPKMSQLEVVAPTEEEQQQQQQQEQEQKAPAPSVVPSQTSQQSPPVLPPKTVTPPTTSLSSATTTTTTTTIITPVPSEISVSDDTHEPASGKQSLESSVSDERYEIPDTSLAPPTRPLPPTAQPSSHPQDSETPESHTEPTEADRYEVPEAPAGTTEAEKEKKEMIETEERYEIPEVVMETAVRTGANGGLCSVAMGRTTTSHLRHLESVFGAPKPAPRRRRSSHPPAPPRPPKSITLTEGSQSLPKTASTSVTAGRPPSATSSFSTTSGNTTSSAPTHAQQQPSPQVKRNVKTRRSWPSLFCDCMYVNCRNYDDVERK